MGFKAIIVDDEEVFNMLLKKMIQRCGFHSDPKTFVSGSLALEYLRKHYDAEDTYVVFLDITMPEMDGWEFLNAIETFVKKSNTYVVMVTSSTDEDDKDRAREYDLVLKYISKPVITDDLVKLKSFPELKAFFD